MKLLQTIVVWIASRGGGNLHCGCSLDCDVALVGISGFCDVISASIDCDVDSSSHGDVGGFAALLSRSRDYSTPTSFDVDSSSRDHGVENASENNSSQGKVGLLSNSTTNSIVDVFEPKEGGNPLQNFDSVNEC
eukprot:scaffold3944_cov132-Skeletonema_menzelii.AAC.1